MRLIQQYIRKHWKLIIFPIMGMLIALGIDSVYPLLQKHFIDDILMEQQFHQLGLFFTIFLSLILIRSVISYGKEYLFDCFSLNVSKDIRRDLFTKIQCLQFSFFDKTNTGELMSRIGEDTDMVWETVSYGLRLFIEMIILIVLSSVLMFSMSPTLALVCLTILIPVCFMGFFFEKKFWDVYLKMSDQTAELNNVAQQNLSGIRLVKAFAREKHEITKFLNTNEKLYDINLKQIKLVVKFSPVIEFFCNMATVALIVVGGILYIKGYASLGVLIAFSTYISHLTWCVRNIGPFVTMLSQNKACMNRIFELLDTEPTIYSKENAYCPSVVKGDITFKNVSFQYHDTMILKNINLFIPAGTSVAIMGPTGCGKSTLLSLIGRYYDVTEGEVLVDGVNVKDWDLTVLRKHLSVVFQDTFLFSDTIYNNINFGEHYTFEAVKEAAKASASLAFIETLEKGFDTEIGERGVGLSGGQKQRLTIARALLQESSILVLDDATSALDMETEYDVLQNIATLSKRRTTFIVAHRISGVKDANLILYMEKGEIIEHGNHQSLLQANGAYYAIYCDQFKEFLALEEAN